jgi:hypothetical protein
VAALSRTQLSAIEQDGTPLDFIAAEMDQAAAWMGDTPVYVGVEAVSIPAFQINITPGQVREMIAIARQSGARGVVLSWDILSMPVENLLAAAV